jgi:hypothetical protein
MSAREKIIQALEDAARTGMWGNIQIDFQHGEPVVIRISETQKLENNNYHERYSK